ncbi:MAG: GIY-YIG nuclease family protein [Methylocystis sp.]
MSHGVPYFAWRNGRPRWVPGPLVRAKGFQGVDFKDDKGNWLPLEIALEEAKKLNAMAGATRANRAAEPARPPKSATTGYVYFMICERHVKIGFSKNPARRMREMGTARAEDVGVLIAVRATQHQEQLVHTCMQRHHYRGEWFHAHADVLALALECATLRDAGLAIRNMEMRATEQSAVSLRRETVSDGRKSSFVLADGSRHPRDKLL